ncbi:ligase-associated DNA damage response exonuclease [Iodidimonas sp. SYSU 1G8]|uniref:ligase-associated DNA damage response exonuclease n=1 Tax=Iodidimonas sp. SYSU 1G8 TaxID=3133967 RepID=UPI0031FE9164
MTSFTDILCPTPQGLYCPPGDFFIDPTRPSPRAVVTHGHSDHARAGHGSVLATAETLAIMGARYGEAFTPARQAARYGEKHRIGDATVWLSPAGHVLGSAQAVIEAHGRRIVVSGDYKRRPDPTCAPFEPVPCDVFVTEATFGLPVFRHPDDGKEVAKVLHTLELFPERCVLVGAYALGKAQRIIALFRRAGHDAPIYLHGALEKLCGLYTSLGVELGDLRLAKDADKVELMGRIVMAPPSALGDRWSRRLPEPVTAFASGWMRVRARARQGGIELPLVISDHADWDELTATLTELSPQEVWVTHGREDALVHWAGLNGLKAKPLHLAGYDEEGGEGPEGDGLKPPEAA